MKVKEESRTVGKNVNIKINNEEIEVVEDVLFLGSYDQEMRV